MVSVVKEVVLCKVGVWKYLVIFFKVVGGCGEKDKVGFVEELIFKWGFVRLV